MRQESVNVLDRLVAEDGTWWAYSAWSDCDWVLLRNYQGKDTFCVKPRAAKARIQWEDGEE